MAPTRKDRCDRPEYVEKQCVEKQHVRHQKIKTQTIEELNVDTLNSNNLNSETSTTENLFIDNKLFPTSIIPIKISESTTITNATGLYALGQSFTGKIRFENCESLSLNLVNLVLTGDSDCALEIVNCNQVIVFKGSINNPNGTSICIDNSTDVAISTVNIRDTARGVLIKNAQDIKVRNCYMQNITQYAIKFETSNNISINNLDVRLSDFSDAALIQGSDSEAIFILKSSFYDTLFNNIMELEKSIIRLDRCFDIKITNNSILRIDYTSAPGTDLEAKHVFLKNSGSAILAGLIIDGNILRVSGNSSGSQSCIAVEDSNNIFIEPNLITDNYVNGDDNSISIKMHAISVKNVFDMIMKGNKINSNFAEGGSNATVREVRAFYGEGGGNWVVAKVQANSSYFKDGTTGSAYGYEVKNVTDYVKFVDCMSNNNGYFDDTNTVYPSEAGGFKVTSTDDSGNNKNVSIDFINCISNSNVGGKLVSGFYSTYDNTTAKNCEANNNFKPFDFVVFVFGYLFPGTVNSRQTNVFLFNCTGNNNSFGITYGVFAGSIDLLLGDGLTKGVTNLEIKKCSFNTNEVGIGIANVKNASVIGNFTNKNTDYGFLAGDCENLSVIANSSVDNNRGFTLNNCPSSIVQKNLARGNGTGFLDDTAGGNTYLSNTSENKFDNYVVIGINNNIVTYTKATGDFSVTPTAWSNLSIV